MMTENAAADLERYDGVCDVLYDEKNIPDENFIIEIMMDKYVSIRAESLDYIWQLGDVSDSLKHAIRERYKDEDSEQCIGRLLLLATKLGDDPSFPSMPTGLSRFEIDYLAIWSSVALATQSEEHSALSIAVCYTAHPDLTLAELAKNLLLEYCLDEQRFAELRQALLGK